MDEEEELIKLFSAALEEVFRADERRMQAVLWAHDNLLYCVRFNDGLGPRDAHFSKS